MMKNNAVNNTENNIIIMITIKVDTKIDIVFNRSVSTTIQVEI